MANHRIYGVPLEAVYPLYVAKAVKKGHTKNEVDEIIRWLTGHTADSFEKQLIGGATMQTFFTDAPKLNPLRSKITGMICGVRVEEIEDPIMREIRQLDKLIDELAKGKPLSKILPMA